MTSVQQQETTNQGEHDHMMNEVIKRECVSMLKRHDDAITIGNGAALYAALDSVRIEMLKRHVGIFPQISDMGLLELCVNAQHRPPRNCDLCEDWLALYVNFRPPKGMREMPPDWVDAVAAFCKWLKAEGREASNG